MSTKIPTRRKRRSTPAKPIPQPATPEEVLAVLRLSEKGQEVASLYEQLRPLVSDANHLAVAVCLADNALGSWAEAWRCKLPEVRLGMTLTGMMSQLLGDWLPGEKMVDPESFKTKKARR